MSLPLISDEQIRLLCKKLKEKEEILDLFQTNAGDALKMIQHSGESLFKILQTSIKYQILIQFWTIIQKR